MGVSLCRSRELFAWRIGHHSFTSLVVFIMAVSVHDAMLLVLNERIILDVEQNPLGRWLLTASDGNVWPFVMLKLLSTALVCAFVMTLGDASPRVAYKVAVGLALFQAALLLYLSFA